MEKSKIRVALKVQCKYIKSLDTQWPKFEGTLEEGFWSLLEQSDVKRHDNGRVTTTSEWVREFKAGKNNKQIIKNTKNLLRRAAEYAEILDLEAEITIGDNPPEPFSHQTEKPSDYYKIKSWK